MPEGGGLTFTTRSDGDTVFTSVSDTGVGISESVKKRIFDPFFTTRTPVGTGLGMSTAYGIIIRHGGSIEVESEEGKGATFNIRIPINSDSTQQKPSAKPVNQEITANKLCVLVVDDSEEMCVVMDNFLTMRGHTVTVVNGGAEAIELAGKKDFDLVLCDLSMPDVYGYDVIEALNKLEKRPKTGIMTGWNEKLKPIDDEVYKVDFIIKKPFKHAELAMRINSLFN
jgi:CheY-like chemotaxis protein